jgi:avidin family protein
MTWLGKWRNQYGSILEIISDSNHRISGTFRTALKDSGFYGQELPVFGAHQGECIGLSARRDALRRPRQFLASLACSEMIGW